MLSTGTSAVPSACLRCQLRQAITRTGRRVSATRPKNPKWSPSRSFGASSSDRNQSANQQALDDEGARNERPRLSEYPLGRITGQPGRRHRETSARLSQDALHKPFEVVVLRDVPDSRAQKVAASTGNLYKQDINGVDGSQIARDVLEEGVVTNDAEIYQSIDALQPTTTILDERQYSDLARSLTDGYNVRQLSHYLAQSLHGVSVDHEHNEGGKSTRRKISIWKSLWRPGQSSLTLRHSVTGIVKKGDVTGTKSKVAEQILRRSWSLLIDVEMQQMGELEVMLKPWQISFLFDLYEKKSTPMYERMIDSPLLCQSSELRPDRADSALRIMARKQDAEEIAERIEKRLRNLVSTELELGFLKPPEVSRSQTTFFGNLFNDTSLQAIQDRLYCIIERKGHDSLVIHAQSETSVHHARRALLSLVDLPSPISIDSTTINTATTNSTIVGTMEQQELVPEQPDLGLRYQSLAVKFGRLKEPTRLHRKHSESDVQTEILRKDHARDLANRLSDTTPPDPIYFSRSASTNSIWNLRGPLSHSRWQVQLCKFLYNEPKISDLKQLLRTNSRQIKDFNGGRSLLIPPTIQSQVPGIANLLSYFTVSSGTVHSPVIVANLMPSPFTKHGSIPVAKLPRLRMMYRIWEYPDQLPKRVVSLQSMQASLDEEELHVHLPQEATDLRVMRRRTLRSASHAPFNAELQNFTRTLQSSIDRERTTLNGDPTIKIRLPREPFADVADAWGQDVRDDHFEVEYLLQGFESKQSLRLLPDNLGRVKKAKSLEVIDPLMRQITDEMPEGMSLKYEEIDGGTIGGRRVGLRLSYSTLSYSTVEGKARLLDHDMRALNSQKVKTATRSESEQKYTTLMETSLRLAHALTRINNGEVGALSDIDNGEKPSYHMSATPELNDVLGQ